jgi:hypothetical protein
MPTEIIFCSIASWKSWDNPTKSNPKVAEPILSIQPFGHGAEVMLDFFSTGSNL